MILMFFGAACYVLLLLGIQIRKKKRLGQPVLMTHSAMSTKERMSVCLRSVLVFAASVILWMKYRAVNPRYLLVLLCAIALYLGYLIFPVICSVVLKKEIGLYDNGVVTYNGIMEYTRMKEYVICENHNHDVNGRNMTVYCKSTIPVMFLTHHFDVESRLGKEVGKIFDKKHKQMQKDAEQKKAK